MKIISGYLGGRSFSSNSNTTHPMSEKMRGALFNALGDIVGLQIMDAFSGSGALSFEAISRGAAKVVAVESNKSAQKDIAENIKTLNLASKVKLIKGPVLGYIKTSPNSIFDVILADPPYEKLQMDTLLALEGRINGGGVMVLSFPPEQSLPEYKLLENLSEKDYGDSRLVFYRKPK
jgi:16S rRNA (guanine966-N2)-methyltransferase